MKKDNLTRIACGIALLASGFALAIVLAERYPRTDLDFDYLGLIVGILALLVTVLIGWQIYSVIKIRETTKAISKTRAEFSLESERNLTQTYLSLSDFFYSRCIGPDLPMSQIEYKYIYYRISAILHASRTGDYETCKTIVKLLLETIRKEYTVLTASGKKDLIYLLSDVCSPRSIPQFCDLVTLIHSLHVKES